MVLISLVSLVFWFFELIVPFKVVALSWMFSCHECFFILVVKDKGGYLLMGSLVIWVVGVAGVCKIFVDVGLVIKLVVLSLVFFEFPLESKFQFRGSLYGFFEGDRLYLFRICV